MLDTLPLQITDTAFREIKNIIQNKGIPKDYGLRIGIRGSGCGATFLLGFDKPKETDETYYLHDLPIYIDKKHLLYLIGITLDFEDTQAGRGFTFSRNEPEKN